eukprot:747675-Hanusia_phi.AAC.1
MSEGSVNVPYQYVDSHFSVEVYPKGFMLNKPPSMQHASFNESGRDLTGQPDCGYSKQACFVLRTSPSESGPGAAGKDCGPGIAGRPLQHRTL